MVERSGKTAENFVNDLVLINKFGLLAVPPSMMKKRLYIGDESYTFASLIKLRGRGSK